MKKIFIAAIAVMITNSIQAADKIINVTISNPTAVEKIDAPVVIAVEGNVKSALVEIDGKEVPCQLDDLDNNGKYDELCFLVNLKKKEKITAKVTYSDTGKPRSYKSRVYGSLKIRDRGTKAEHIAMTSLTVPAESNPYQYVFPHGPLMESEMVGFRVYADHRQSVDFYGHKVKQLELEETAFYPSKEQKAGNYGDDVLYTGSTYGCGTMHGWDGKTSVMFTDVTTRTYTILTKGPLRTIIETINKGWRITPDAEPVDVTTHYILYAGHRDVEMDIKFSRSVSDLQLSTGVTDIIGSEKISDGKGLLGCWGTALAGNNPKVYENHTVGLAVCVPKKYYKGEAYFTDTPKDKAGTMDANGKLIMPNQAYVSLIGTKTDHLQYWFAATCDLETFGYKDSKEWLKWLKEWKKALESPVSVRINKK